MDPFRNLTLSRSMVALPNIDPLPPPHVGLKPPRCLIRLRILTLVVNTANIINDRMTHSLGRLHALLAPVTFFIVCIFMTCFIVGACYRSYGSQFLQAYALLICGFMECVLAYTVFSQLMTCKMELHITLPMVLNGVLPVINALLMGSDVVVMLLSSREQIVIEDTT
ncbi:hypothetical protein O0L34_g4213 [Tuta absoluta]|nr:hypothetical protein O0L34_g4213 [Tuta absoluta]